MPPQSNPKLLILVEPSDDPKESSVPTSAKVPEVEDVLYLASLESELSELQLSLEEMDSQK